MVVKVGLIIDVYIIIGLYAYGSKSVGPLHIIFCRMFTGWLFAGWPSAREMNPL